MKTQVEATYLLEAETPRAAVKGLLEVLLVGGVELEVLVREVGGRGGGVVRVVLASEGDRPPAGGSQVVGVSRTFRVDREVLVAEVLEEGDR